MSASQSPQFALALLQRLYEPNCNLVASPYSLAAALAMLLPGTDGNSRLELIKALFDGNSNSVQDGLKHFQLFAQNTKENLQKNGKTLSIANLLYSQQSFPIKPEYVSLLSTELGAVARQLDFIGHKNEALQTINGDVSQATRGLIKQLLSDIDSSTRLILVNAIHFKGLWAKPFEKKETDENGRFHLATGETVKAAMMRKTKLWPYFEDETIKCKAVQLDYQAEGNIAMVLILPEEGMQLGTFIASQLTVDLIRLMLDNLYPKGSVQLAVPRFKLSSEHHLVPALRSLGIDEVFGPAANLSNASPCAGQLFVSEVLQKAVIEVNEEGTEAAAATVMAIAMCCSATIRPLPKKFIADRPFLYALVTKDRPKQVLFIGVVEDPSKGP